MKKLTYFIDICIGWNRAASSCGKRADWRVGHNCETRDTILRPAQQRNRLPRNRRQLAKVC